MWTCTSLKIPRGSQGSTNQRSCQRTAIWPQTPPLTVEHLSSLPAAKWQIREAAQGGTRYTCCSRRLFSSHPSFYRPSATPGSSSRCPATVFYWSHYVNTRRNSVFAAATIQSYSHWICPRRFASSYIMSRASVHAQFTPQHWTFIPAVYKLSTLADWFDWTRPRCIAACAGGFVWTGSLAGEAFELAFYAPFVLLYMRQLSRL